MRPVVYLDRRIKVKLIRWIQRLQRISKRAVVVRHGVLADKLGCSESTIKRAVRELVAEGHLLREHMRRTRGGYLCVYRARLDVIYRTASTLRRAGDLLPNGSELALQALQRSESETVSQASRKGSKYRRTVHESIYPRASLKDLLMYADVLGIPASQRSYLALLARRFGVYDAWHALVIALRSGQARNPVAYAWGVIRRWYPQRKKVAT